MEDPSNLIFVLRAVSDFAAAVFSDPHNEQYYVPPVARSPLPSLSREATPATNVGDDLDLSGLQELAPVYHIPNCVGRRDLSHQLQFTFEQRPKDISEGFVFGSNPKLCDVLLGSPDEGISGSHFRITFDDDDRLVLIDSSTRGTAVGYNGQARMQRRNNPRNRGRSITRDASRDFRWILFAEVEHISVLIEGTPRSGDRNGPVLEFMVETVLPDVYHEELKSSRRNFLYEMRTAVSFALNIDSHPTTAGQSVLHSPEEPPNQRPVWIETHQIDNGEFGVVYRVLDVSNASVYAAKKLIHNGEAHRHRWNREVALLRELHHVRCDLFEENSPC